MLRAGNAVQALKPCLIMSPLSVSRFIPSGTVTFDCNRSRAGVRIQAATVLDGVVNGSSEGAGWPAYFASIAPIRYW